MDNYLKAVNNAFHPFGNGNQWQLDIALFERKIAEEAGIIIRWQSDQIASPPHFEIMGIEDLEKATMFKLRYG